MNRIHILVVEDEETIREGLCDVLAFRGYHPIAVATGEEGVTKATSGTFSLVLLDLMLPGLHGLDVCRELRRTSPGLPILILTALGSEDDVVRGFEAGADDYVAKPFSVRELTVRVEALLRRSGSIHGECSFEFGPWTIDAEGLRAVGPAGSVDLTHREVGLLTFFHRQKDRVVSRRRLLEEVWRVNRADLMETRTVDVHISKLRRKIGKAGSPLIQTVRGAGYCYSP